ncbi:MAG: hypothetical protein ABSC11_06515 [Smithella sp.]
MIYAIMAQIINKEMICFYCAPFGDAFRFTYVDKAHNAGLRRGTLYQQG